jgi:hypothetical protein
MESSAKIRSVVPIAIITMSIGVNSSRPLTRVVRRAPSAFRLIGRIWRAHRISTFSL